MMARRLSASPICRTRAPSGPVQQPPVDLAPDARRQHLEVARTGGQAQQPDHGIEQFPVSVADRDGGPRVRLPGRGPGLQQQLRDDRGVEREPEGQKRLGGSGPGDLRGQGKLDGNNEILAGVVLEDAISC